MHNLLITAEKNVPDPYGNVLGDTEVVTGVMVAWVFRVENIGTEPFNGGQISKLTIQTPFT